jgi:hypothetical protein
MLQSVGAGGARGVVYPRGDDEEEFMIYEQEMEHRARRIGVWKEGGQEDEVKRWDPEDFSCCGGVGVENGMYVRLSGIGESASGANGEAEEWGEGEVGQMVGQSSKSFVGSVFDKVRVSSSYMVKSTKGTNRTICPRQHPLMCAQSSKSVIKIHFQLPRTLELQPAIETILNHGSQSSVINTTPKRI